MEYTYELIRSLNEEYSVKPLVTGFRVYTREEQLKNAAKKLESLNQKIQLRGLKVLEIGSGGGVWHIFSRSNTAVMSRG